MKAGKGPSYYSLPLMSLCTSSVTYYLFICLFIFCNKGKEWVEKGQAPIRGHQHTQVGYSSQLTPVSFRREASCSMSVSCGPLGTSLTQEILRSLGLADKVWTAGTSEMYLCTQWCCVGDFILGATLARLVPSTEPHLQPNNKF